MKEKKNAKKEARKLAKKEKLKIERLETAAGEAPVVGVQKESSSSVSSDSTDSDATPALQNTIEKEKELARKEKKKGKREKKKREPEDTPDLEGADDKLTMSARRATHNKLE